MFFRMASSNFDEKEELECDELPRYPLSTVHNIAEMVVVLVVENTYRVYHMHADVILLLLFDTQRQHLNFFSAAYHRTSRGEKALVMIMVIMMNNLVVLTGEKE